MIPQKIMIPNPYESSTTVNNLKSEENKKKNYHKIIFDTYKASKLGKRYRAHWEDEEVKSFVEFWNSNESFDNWEHLTTQWNIIAQKNGFPKRVSKGLQNKLGRLQNPSGELSPIKISSIDKVKGIALKKTSINVKSLDMNSSSQSSQSEIAKDLLPPTDRELDNLRKNVPIINLSNLRHLRK